MPRNTTLLKAQELRYDAEILEQAVECGDSDQVIELATQVVIRGLILLRGDFDIDLLDTAEMVELERAVVDFLEREEQLQ